MAPSRQFESILTGNSVLTTSIKMAYNSLDFRPSFDSKNMMWKRRLTVYAVMESSDASDGCTRVQLSTSGHCCSTIVQGYPGVRILFETTSRRRLSLWARLARPLPKKPLEAQAIFPRPVRPVRPAGWLASLTGIIFPKINYRSWWTGYTRGQYETYITWEVRICENCCETKKKSK